MKINMIYISNTGNTEMMADAVKEACEAKGIDLSVYQENPGADKLLDGDFLFVGSPAVGTEEYDATMIKPMMENIADFKGAKTVLFGSYGWGGGDYMNDLKHDIEEKGAKVINTFTFEDAPDDEALEDLKKIVEKL